MIKGVLGQPNFSPPNKRNTIIQNFPSFFTENSNLSHSSNLTQLDMFVLTLTDDKLLKFVLIWGKSCVAFVWGRKVGLSQNPFYHTTYSLTHLLTYSLTHLLTYSLTYSLTHSLTHSLTYSHTHSLTRSLTHSLTHILTYSLTHSLTYFGGTVFL